MNYRLMYCVKGAHAGKNSLCCEWVASSLARLLVDGDDSLPVQLDVERVRSVLELPLKEPELFWKLP
jgi:hypothetical protein